MGGGNEFVDSPESHAISLNLEIISGPLVRQSFW